MGNGAFAEPCEFCRLNDGDKRAVWRCSGFFIFLAVARYGHAVSFFAYDYFAIIQRVNAGGDGVNFPAAFFKFSDLLCNFIASNLFCVAGATYARKSARNFNGRLLCLHD